MSSSVIIQVGQCGNQLGHELFQTLFDESYSAQPLYGSSPVDSVSLCRQSQRLTWNRRHREGFFRPNRWADENEEIENFILEHCEGRNKFEVDTGKPRRVARAVLVDTEPRVVDSCLLKKNRGWAYSSENAIKLEGGSGNNWAQGFYEHGPRTAERVIELVRAESEKCESLDSFVLLQSVAGGTGSGLGAFVTGALRDAFPNTALINSLVCPHASGEIVVHSYNTIFTAANLQDHSNALICFSNDDARRICTKMLGIKRPEMEHFNRLFSRDLVSGLFRPSVHIGGRRPKSLSGLARFLCSVQKRKYVSILTHPQVSIEAISYTSDPWSSILKAISVGDKPTASVASFYGKGAKESASQRQRDVKHEELQRHDECTILGHEKSVSVAFNSASVTRPLDQALKTAYRMFSSGAYVHQYATYGMERDDFYGCFTQAEQILANYKELNR